MYKKNTFVNSSQVYIQIILKSIFLKLPPIPGNTLPEGTVIHRGPDFLKMWKFTWKKNKFFDNFYFILVKFRSFGLKPFIEIWVFEHNLDIWAKFTKISIFDQISIFDRKFYFRSKFRYLRNILIFWLKKFDSWSKVRFLINISIF